MQWRKRPEEDDMSGYRHLDIATAPLSGVAANPGARQQVLWRDERSGASVAINYTPAGFTAQHAKMLAEEGAHCHYHATVNERHYMLAGDYPIWHWTGPGAEPTLTVLRRHTYLENPPRTLHGSRPELRPQVGTQLLVWNTKGGTSIFAADARHETFRLQPGEQAPRDGWARPTIHTVDTMAWQAHPTARGWKIKNLAPAIPDSPAVFVVNVPCDASAPPATIAGAERRWLFVLSGDLAVAMNGQALALREGHFVHWAPDTRLAFADAAISSGGATVLCIGHDLATER
jgi:mannose-6-phosphate isomerase-like protein (cupin superfamily)